MEAMAESPVVDACDREMILSKRVYIVSCANVRKPLLLNAYTQADYVRYCTHIHEVCHKRSHVVLQDRVIR